MEKKYFVWKKIETDISYFKCGLFERRHVESPNSPRSLQQSPYYPLWTTVDKMPLFNDNSGNRMTSFNPKWRLLRKSDIDIAFICFQFQMSGSWIPCFRQNHWNDISIYLMLTYSTSGGFLFDPVSYNLNSMLHLLAHLLIHARARYKEFFSSLQTALDK